MNTTPTTALLAATILIAAAAPPAVAQEASDPQPAAADTVDFTLLQHGMPIATERVVRSAGRLTTVTEVVNQPRLLTDATLRDDATVARLELRVMPADDPDGEPLQTSAAEFEDGTVVVEQPIGTTVGEPAGIPTGAVPYLNPSPAYMEQIVRRARAIGGDSVTVQVWLPGPGGGRVLPATVAFEEGGAVLGLGGVDVDLDLDPDGGIRTGRVPAQGLVIERTGGG